MPFYEGKIKMNTEIQALIKTINYETTRIKKEPPKIIIDIFQRGIIKNKAGTRGQYFSTLVFIQGVCRSLAYDSVNNFIYMLDEVTFTKEQLMIMLPRYFRSNAQFLGVCGFDDVWNFAKSIINNLDKIKTKAELSKLVYSYNYYLANLYTWVQHYFPWEMGPKFLHHDS
jgi:hypothetical protein